MLIIFIVNVLKLYYILLSVHFLYFIFILLCYSSVLLGVCISMHFVELHMSNFFNRQMMMNW